MSVTSTRHRVALALALLGAAVSVVTLTVHQRVAAGGDFTSFCNLGGAINCDAVLGSRWGQFLGVPVTAWALAMFLLGAALALPGALSRRAAGVYELLLLGLVSGSAGYALVLAGVMAQLGKVCLLCLSIDAVIVAWALAVVPLVRRFDPLPAVAWQGRRAARSVVAAGVIVSLAAGTFAATRRPAAAHTLAEVRARDPRFYQWYTNLPVRSAQELGSPHAPRKGPAKAKVAIVEFSDFQCPYCVQAYRDLRDLVRDCSDVSVVFRHFPLDQRCNSLLDVSPHPDACLAACAAECAGRQGKFWEYHDVLFERQDRLTRDNLVRYASEMRLDVPAFQACLDDPGTLARISEDVQMAARMGVDSTPTLFINGRTVEGALSRTHYDYAIIIERELREGHTPASRGAS